eukprot:3103569-Amphidinium_carterae.1
MELSDLEPAMERPHWSVLVLQAQQMQACLICHCFLLCHADFFGFALPNKSWQKVEIKMLIASVGAEVISAIFADAESSAALSS